jgi:hypothetical protein
MADYSDYYSVIARAVSDLPSNTEEARRAVYERARTAFQERLRTLDPPISEPEIAHQQLKLEVAIQRVEMETVFGAIVRPLVGSDKIISEKYQGSKTTHELQRLLAKVVPTQADITASKERN